MHFKINCSTSTFSVSRPPVFPPKRWVHTMKLIRKTANKRVQRGFDSVKQRFTLLNNNKVTAMLFSSGAVVLLGCKSQQELTEATNAISQDLKSPLIRPVTVSNVAGSTFYGGHINLTSLHKYSRENLHQGYKVDLDPELFPALVISSKEPGSRKKALIYHTGKIIITGVKSFNECHLFCNEIECLVSVKQLKSIEL